MTKQRYAITKYSKKTYSNTFRQLQKQRRFKDTNQVYRVDRIRPSSDEYIGDFTTLAKATAAISHHAYKVLKTTTKLDVRINRGRGFKKVKM